MAKSSLKSPEWPPELIAKLREAQAARGALTKEVLSEVAKSSGLPLQDVYGVATFYHFFGAGPRGRHVIRICKSLLCHLKDYEMVVGAVAREIGIGPGETTADGRFSFELTNCIGLCDQAPAMLINDDPHGELTPAKIAEILRNYK